MTDSKYTQQQESELSESRNTPYDPVLEQRIADMKRGVQPYSSTSNQGVTTAPTVAESTQNLSKLEEVLKRQRERLENISGSFGGQGSSSLQDHNVQGSSIQPYGSQGTQ